MDKELRLSILWFSGVLFLGLGFRSPGDSPTLWGAWFIVWGSVCWSFAFLDWVLRTDETGALIGEVGASIRAGVEKIRQNNNGFRVVLFDGEGNRVEPVPEEGCEHGTTFICRCCGKDVEVTEVTCGECSKKVGRDLESESTQLQESAVEGCVTLGETLRQGERYVGRREVLNIVRQYKDKTVERYEGGMISLEALGEAASVCNDILDRFEPVEKEVEKERVTERKAGEDRWVTDSSLRTTLDSCGSENDFCRGKRKVLSTVQSLQNKTKEKIDSVVALNPSGYSHELSHLDTRMEAFEDVRVDKEEKAEEREEQGETKRARDAYEESGRLKAYQGLKDYAEVQRDRWMQISNKNLPRSFREEGRITGRIQAYSDVLEALSMRMSDS